MKDMKTRSTRLLILLLLAILLAFTSSPFLQQSDLTDFQFPKLLPQWTQEVHHRYTKIPHFTPFLHLFTLTPFLQLTALINLRLVNFGLTLFDWYFPSFICSFFLSEYEFLSL